MRPEEVKEGGSYYSDSGPVRGVGGPYLIDKIYQHEKTGKTLVSYRLGTDMSKPLIGELSVVCEWLVGEYL